MHASHGKTVRERWNQHSLILVVGGFFFITMGYNYIYTELSVSRKVGLYYALGVMDIDKWGFVFIGIGLVVIMLSIWPVNRLPWGYMLMTGHCTAWGLFYLVGIIGPADLSTAGNSLAWLILAFLWWAIAGLISPDRLQALAERIKLEDRP